MAPNEPVSGQVSSSTLGMSAVLKCGWLEVGDKGLTVGGLLEVGVKPLCRNMSYLDRVVKAKEYSTAPAAKKVKRAVRKLKVI